MVQQFCYVCFKVQKEEDLMSYVGPKMQDLQIQVCDDCWEDQQIFKYWDRLKINQRAQDYKNQKIEDLQKITDQNKEVSHEKKQLGTNSQQQQFQKSIESQVSATIETNPEKKEQLSIVQKVHQQQAKESQAINTNDIHEEEKQSTGNVYILLQNQALKFQTHTQNWSLIEQNFDSSISLNEEQICEFSLISSSSGQAQLYGIKQRNFIITGGIVYQELCFYTNVNSRADTLTISGGPNLNVERHSHAMAVNGGEIKSEQAYIIGGIELSNQENKGQEKGIKLTHTIQVLNLTQNKHWVAIKDLKLKYGRISPSAVIFGEFLYVIAGFSQKHINSQKLPQYPETLSLSQNIERFNISNKSQHTVLDISYDKPQSFPTASFNIMPIYSQKQILIVGGTTGKRVLSSIFRLKIDQDKVFATHELQMQSVRANAMISRVGNFGMYIFGGAQSQGSCEYADLGNKQSFTIFDYHSCLQKASTIRQIQYSDLRWSCCFFK